MPIKWASSDAVNVLMFLLPGFVAASHSPTTGKPKRPQPKTAGLTTAKLALLVPAGLRCRGALWMIQNKNAYMWWAQVFPRD